MRPLEYGSFLRAGEGKRYWVLGDLMTSKTPQRFANGQFALFETICTPGGGPPPHLHKHEDEAFYIVEGNFEFLLNDRLISAPSGSFVYAPRNQVHQFRCVGPGQGKFMVWSQPGHFEHFVSELGTPLENVPHAPAVDAYTIERLQRMCDLYGIELHYDAAAMGPAPMRPAPKSYWVLGDRVKVLCTGEETTNSLCVAEVTSLPGGGPPPHVHKEADEVMYILDGRFEIMLGTRTVIAERGAAVHVPRGTLHDFRNIGATTGRFLSYHTPAGIEHFFAECGTLEGTARPTTLIDPKWVSRVAQKHGRETTAVA